MVKKKTSKKDAKPIKAAKPAKIAKEQVAKPAVPQDAGGKAAPVVDEKREAIRKAKLKHAEQFKEEVLKKAQKVVKAVVLFGSLVRNDYHEKSDIDMLVVIDDVMTRFTPEQKDEFDDMLRNIGKKISPDIVVQPAWTLSEFWDMARIGHPLLYTIVRDGWALYDTGFFIPVRKLLELGKIPTTIEAVEKFMEACPQKISRVETAKLYMVAEDLYYAMLNSAQAVLMYLGEPPPSPKHCPDAVKEHLVIPQLLEEVYLNDIREVVEFRKGVEHKEIKELTGEKLDEFINKTKKFVDRMEQLLNTLQKKRKYTMIEKNYEVMIKAAVHALKTMDKLPPDPKDLPKAIKEDLIDQGHVEHYHGDTFRRVVTMRKMLDDKKADEIPLKDLELTREYVRRFVRDLAPIIEGKLKKKK
ncbi:MAG: nucleotidyltransferase domain-containing protein [Candidatus Aenigmarchaeota archaeon]|nr:nucleotidyltransferase domain-containing protein [Candidatus Aenigmarchaeota archaeon]